MYFIHVYFPDKPTKPPIEVNTTENTWLISSQNPHKFTVGCTVKYGKHGKYGVIKWIGNFPDDQKTAYAGLITVSF